MAGEAGAAPEPAPGDDKENKENNEGGENKAGWLAGFGVGLTPFQSAEFSRLASRWTWKISSDQITSLIAATGVESST